MLINKEDENVQHGGLFVTYDEVIELHIEFQKERNRLLEELKHYKDLEEQGRLIELPCEVGRIVYRIVTDKECKYNNDCPLHDCYKCEDGIDCEHFIYNRYITQIEFNQYMLGAIGRTVFLTKEEAKKKLKEVD